ncbi:MAG: DM13 domain-containing protein [Paracoccaceae bacterium]|nr:DM13 domain-containing protein [Paracoccaceae bacterium]
MGRFVLIAIPVFLIGFGSGAAFWYLASPLFFHDVVSETFSDATLEPTRSGAFRDADRVHQGQGMATLFEDGAGRAVLRFTDFEVTNGPDLEVWLVGAADPQSSADVTNSTWLSLGRLKGNIGDQNYDIPAGTDLSQYGSVVIWCEQFGVLFSPATLN